MSQTGKRRHLIEIQRSTNDGDSFDPIITWSKVANRYASIIPSSPRDYNQNDQLYAEASHTIEMPYIADIKSEDRVSFNGRTFEILGLPINVEERSRVTRLITKETV